MLEGNKHRINNNSIQEVIVIVKDTGSGIDTEVVPKLFSKFAAKSDHRTGLGLFISKNIIEAYVARYGLRIILEEREGQPLAYH